MSNGWFETVAEAQRRAKRRLPRSVYGALVAGSEKRRDRQGQTSAPSASLVSRRTWRGCRRSVTFDYGDGSAGVAAGAHLTNRGAGRAPRRRGGRGATAAARGTAMGLSSVRE